MLLPCKLYSTTAQLEVVKDVDDPEELLEVAQMNKMSRYWVDILPLPTSETAEKV